MTYLAVAGAPQQRADSSHELGEVERLRQVVVAPGAEAGEAIGQGAARREEDHRRVDALSTQRLDDVAPVGVGQADVDDEGVGNGALDPVQQRRAAPDALCPVRLFAQAAHEEGAHLDIVLEDEDVRFAHCSRSMEPSGMRLKSRAASAIDATALRTPAGVAPVGSEGLALRIPTATVRRREQPTSGPRADPDEILGGQSRHCSLGEACHLRSHDASRPVSVGPRQPHVKMRRDPSSMNPGAVA